MTLLTTHLLRRSLIDSAIDGKDTAKIGGVAEAARLPPVDQRIWDSSFVL